MRNSALLLIALPMPLLAALEQNSPPTRSTDEPAFVWDVDPSLTDGFRSFRTTSDPLKAKSGEAAPNVTGLAGLHASGSSEFTTAGLKTMAAKFVGHGVIFDLRQEDHGFVNGEPVSWYATNNWANVGKSHDEIVAEELARLAAIKPGASIALTDDKAKKGTGESEMKTEQVRAVSTEAELAASLGFNYVRITVSDHCRPTDPEVDRFVEAVRQLPPDAWAHFHCRAGKGRTTTFMALYDMLRNAPAVSLRDIVDRQSLLIGDYDLLSKTADAGPKAGVAADRAVFVRAFYDYAKANPGGRPLLWTQWLKTQP